MPARIMRVPSVAPVSMAGTTGSPGQNLLVLAVTAAITWGSMGCRACDYASWTDGDYFGAGAGGGGSGGDAGGAAANSVRKAAGGHTDRGEEFELLLSADDVPDFERGGEPGDVDADRKS